jgi:carboxylesterase type B
MSTTATTTLSHPSLGTLTGLLNNSTTSFRGLKYATLTSPFAASSLNTSPLKGDATQYGPEPLQNPGACGIEWFLIGASCPVEDGVQQKWSRTECLTLNITAPATVPENKLPVLIFIHGSLPRSSAGNYSLTLRIRRRIYARRLIMAAILAHLPRSLLH